MRVIERGSGPPLVLVPGIQGRWEYARPTIGALAQSFHVVTFPLCGEPGSGARFDSALGFDNYTGQIRRALDVCHVDRATVCGISFGGLAALRFAAAEPSRASALVLASTPGPGWHLKKRHEAYARVPWLFGPLFLAETPLRLWAEIARAIPRFEDRSRFWIAQLRTLMTAPLSFDRMAKRALTIPTFDVLVDCSRVTVPTLVVTGESPIDHVVSAGASSEYARLIRNARAAVLERTGHLGSVTRPDAFADLVRQFVQDASERDRTKGVTLEDTVVAGGHGFLQRDPP